MGACYPRKVLKIYILAMAILVHFEQLLRQVLLIFYACIKIKLKDYCFIKEVQNYGKIVFTKNIVENGWEGCIPHTPLNLPLAPHCCLHVQNWVIFLRWDAGEEGQLHAQSHV